MIERTFEELDIGYSRDKEETLRKYMELVLERNQHVNLTAITDPEEFIEKHYVDSLAVAGLEEFRKAERVMDIGTGGGFPGVPLAVAFPEKRFTLADSLNKRIRIIQEFCDELGIGNVTAIHGRAEDLGRKEDLREQFDVCVSRAVADLRVLAEYCLPFVKRGGYFIAYKGAGCEEEVRGAEHAIDLLGGQIEGIVPAFARRRDGSMSESNGRRRGVPGIHENMREHRLVIIRKAEHTPKAYPRKAGTPAKKPLGNER